MADQRAVARREVRLGLVLYGGVSLAVYENGVAQELYRAFRGQGIYGLIRELIDSDIVLDVISGASAGGVNGVMLAYALANGRQFAPSAQLWRDEAGIERLLQPDAGKPAMSVLNSNYYQCRLEHCFNETLKPDPGAPEPEELDLFVTGTDARGAVSTVYDSAGHPIDIKNHRALFRLKYRKSRTNDLRPGNATHLATLCRLTSCFPVAFEPVAIASDQTELVTWGKLRLDPPPRTAYLDGGILNNKPFTSTIEAIAGRTARGDVERFLIYVEPDPENFAAKADEDIPPPSILDAATTSLLSIPRYQSIALDLDSVQSHNERAEKMLEIAASLRSNVDLSDGSGTPEVWPQNGPPGPYQTARLMQLRDAAVEALLNDSKGRPWFSEHERSSARILVESFSAWPGEGEETLRNYDVFFRKRRADYLTQVLMQDQKDGKPRLPKFWDVVNHFFEMYEMVEFALVRALTDEWQYDWRTLADRYPALASQPRSERDLTLVKTATAAWGAAKAVLDNLLLRNIPLPNADADGRTVFFRQLMHREAPTSGQNILHVIDSAFGSALRALEDSELVGEFQGFFDTDRQLFPLQFASGFESTHRIRVVRFSPQDAQRCRSNKPVKEKVRGLALSAFGGFLRKSWRANDIMFGRLDGACSLIECLVTKERLAAVGKTGLDNATAYATRSGNADYAKCIAALQTYFELGERAERGDWNNLVNTLVGTCHEEIDREESGYVRAARAQEDREYKREPSDTTLPARLLADTAVRAGGRLKESLVVSEPNALRHQVEKNALYWLTFNVAYRAYAGWHRVSGWFYRARNR